MRILFYLALFISLSVIVTLAQPEKAPTKVLDGCVDLLCSPHADCIATVRGLECVCQKGYEGDGHICTDINECDPSRNPCYDKKTCVNYEGGFSCTCPEGYEGDGVNCVFGQRGTFSAILNEEEESGSVEPGLFLKLRGGDEITIDQDQARSYVDPGWEVSKKGQLVEAEVYYDLPAELNAGVVGTHVIEYNAIDGEGNEAQPRFRKVHVTDVDECAKGQHVCSENANCVNTVGSYECVCKEGFEGNGFKCHDLDECKLGTHNCSSKANCTNTMGSFRCQCIEGYEGDGVTCVDIDECLRNVHNCDEHASCTNTEGSYECTCDPGYQGNGFHCKAIDSCEEGTHDCHEYAECIRTGSGPADYVCKCRRGFHGDGRRCTDINECENPDMFSCPLNAHCENTVGSYRCTCDKGYEKADDDYSCIDIDECLQETHDCSPHAICTNLQGSYQCACKEGYTGNGHECLPLEKNPDIVLHGSNPKVMRQCEPYIEEGFALNESKKNKLRVSVTMPPALMAETVNKLGNFSIKYSVVDGRKVISEMIRRVNVEAVNPCEAPEGNKCRHKCHSFATCVFLDPGYKCECKVGFETVFNETTGETFCRDNVPPVIELFGVEHVMLNACRVCEWYDPGELYDEKKHGGYRAYDILPGGHVVDFTDKVRVTTIKVDDSNWRIEYDVNDTAGNPATTRVRIVTKRVEDILRRIETVEAFLEKRFQEFEPPVKSFSTFQYYTSLLFKAFAFVLGILLLFYLLPRLWNLLKVMVLNNEPNFTEYADAYDLYYAFVRPWWSASYRARRIQMEYQQRKYD
jgi:hypothetical protein